MKKYDIYTNGSYKHATNKGGWGFYVEQTGYSSKGAVKKPISSTLMEYQAVLKALRYAKQHVQGKVTIHTNLQRIKTNVNTKTICKNSKMKLRYLDLTRSEICTLMQQIKPLQFKKVKAHSGVPGNEMANKLAKEGMERSSIPKTI